MELPAWLPKLKALAPGAMALIAAALVSIVLIENTIVMLSCLVVAFATVAVASFRCIQPKCSRWRALGATVVPGILFIAITWSHLPQRIAFRLHRPQFEHASSQIVAGKPPATPFWIGPFRIKMAGRRGDPGTPYLATNQDEYEINGFVRHPRGHGFNLWSCISLDDQWSYIAED